MNYRLGDLLPIQREGAYRSSMIHPKQALIPEGLFMQLETFHERLLWARRHAKITQKELVKRMKEEYSVPIGSNYVSELEIGNGKKPTFEVVRAMAGVLGISMDWLARFTEAPEPTSPDVNATYFSEEADQAAQLIDKMQPDQRIIILNLARNLASQQSPERQQRLDNTLEILDSIERKHGRKKRLEVERILRGNDFDPSADT